MSSLFIAVIEECNDLLHTQKSQDITYITRLIQTNNSETFQEKNLNNYTRRL